jgi:hypothetical protein
MAAMSRDVDPKTARLYDKRTVERNIKKGLISRKDYEKHLKTLEDVSDKGAFGAIEEGSDEDDLDDEEADDVAAEPAPSTPPDAQS